MPKNILQINDNLIPCYELTVNPPANAADESNWFARLAGSKMDTDNIGPSQVVNTAVNHEDDLIFAWKDKYYLLEHKDLNRFQPAVLQALRSASDSNPYLNKASIKPSYRNRVLRNSTALKIEDEKAEGINNLSAKYRVGSWFTGAPALAGAMTLAAFTGDKALAGLKTVANDGTYGAAIVKSPLLVSLAIVPLTAALAAFSMTYAANYVMYRLENNGLPPTPEASKQIWNSSVRRSLQMGLGFLAVEGTRQLLEASLGTALEHAWGGAVKMGGNICPSEIRCAVMLSMSLAIGLGMALGSLIINATNKNMTNKAYIAQALTAFGVGLVAGAVSSIDFGNKGFSFLATWASLTLLPTMRLATHDGRQEVKSSVTRVGTSAKLMLSKVSDAFPTIPSIDEISVASKQMGPGPSGMVFGGS